MRRLVLVLAACNSAAPSRTTDKPVTPEAAPSPPLDLPIIDIDAGAMHTCVVFKNRRVACWGDNRAGQLGDGTNITRAKPVIVPIEAVDVSGGEDHTCVRRPSGEVACWGGNSKGQLGDGTTEDRVQPVAVRGLRDVVEIATGFDHTCARHAGGTVSCWGGNERGQLGDGTLDDRVFAGPVSGISDATRIVAGEHTTCAIVQNGKVACWGDNTESQLGLARSRTLPGTEVLVDRLAVEPDDTTSEQRWLQTLPAILPSIDAVAIDASHLVTCVTRISGVVTCFGKSFYGLLGRNDLSALKGDISGARGAAELAIGHSEACARKLDGTVVCWGDRSLDLRPLPTRAVAITSGTKHGCAILVNGEVRCWGDNNFDQLGTGEPFNGELGAVTELRGSSQITTGFEHGCGLRAGRVWCFKQREAPVAVSNLSNVTQIASGWHHDCAVLASKRVVCWGDPFSGSLGNGSVEPSAVPVAVKGITDAVEVSASGTRTCVRHATGRVSCWGDNAEGWLGVDSKSMVTVPRQIPRLENVVEIGVGTHHTCARRADRRVVCWGFNGEGGVLGDGTQIDRRSPVGVLDLPPVDELTTGAQHACARAGGQVWCWGHNGDGQLGDGTEIPRAQPVRVVNVEDAVAIAAEGSSHTCALRANGRVVCWGNNSAFQLGHGSGQSRSRPQDVVGIDDAVAISVGELNSCALRSNGDVTCWPRSVPNTRRPVESSDEARAVVFE